MATIHHQPGDGPMDLVQFKKSLSWWLPEARKRLELLKVPNSGAISRQKKTPAIPSIAAGSLAVAAVAAVASAAVESTCGRDVDVTRTSAGYHVDYIDYV